jgi:hypothetical protein
VGPLEIQLVNGFVNNSEAVTEVLNVVNVVTGWTAENLVTTILCRLSDQNAYRAGWYGVAAFGRARFAAKYVCC